jgi:hypothetical protein
MFVHQLTGRREDDVVNVHRGPAGVRPETGIDLLGVHELVDNGGRTTEQRAELACFIIG